MKWKIINNVSCPFSELWAIYDPMGWGGAVMKFILGTLRNQLHRRQRERQKTIGFNKQNNNFARASRFFVHFFARFCTTTTWKYLISRFTEYENNHRRNFISISEPGYDA